MRAGFTFNTPIAVAIAHAESGFRTDAIGDVNLTEPGEKSVGLWQINYRPSRDPDGGWRDPILNLDPSHNAQAAFLISGGGARFTPWSAYTNSAYKPFLAEAISAYQTLLQEVIVPTIGPTLIQLQTTPSGQGYYILADDGAIYAFGDAIYHGGLIRADNGAWVVR